MEEGKSYLHEVEGEEETKVKPLHGDLSVGREERRGKGKYGEKKLLTNDYGSPLKEKCNIGFHFFCVVICCHSKPFFHLNFIHVCLIC